MPHYRRPSVCALPAKIRPSADLAYLAGLLHDFGLLLMGHLFQKEFLALNRNILSHPERSIIEIEQEVLGLGHAEIGAVLMERWDLPSEVIVAIREHHNDYDGPHAVYSNIVRLSNWILAQQALEPEPEMALPETLLCALGLKQGRVMLIAEQILGDGDALSQMAQKLAN